MKTEFYANLIWMGIAIILFLMVWLLIKLEKWKENTYEDKQSPVSGIDTSDWDEGAKLYLTEDNNLTDKVPSK